MAVRTRTEKIMDIRNNIRYLEVPLHEKCFIFGDNKSVVNSSSLADTKLHKHHIILSFRRVREAITAGVITFKFLVGKDNPDDIISKHWGYQQVWNILQPILFWRGYTMDPIPNQDNDAIKDDETHNSPIICINGVVEYPHVYYKWLIYTASNIKVPE